MSSNKKIVLLARCERHFLESFYFQKLKQGIDAAIEGTDYQLVLSQQESNFLEIIPKNDQRNIGFLNIAPHINHISVKTLEKSKLPATLINCRSPKISWVDSDNIRGVKLVMDHLIKLGRERILFINGFPESQNAIDRLEGYKESLENHNIEYDPKLVIYCDFSITITYEKIKNLLKSKTHSPFDSIFAANDLMAVGAIRALSDQSINVPNEVSVIGYDDFDFSATFQLPLTTYRQPFLNIGYLATKFLISQIESKKPILYQAELIGELIVRNSCGSN
jgi:LacI family transcriptional regulator